MITNKSTFNEVFGDYFNAYTEEEKKSRWETYKKTLSKNSLKYWIDTEACNGCLHLDNSNAWCKDNELPCTVNPVFGLKMIGMACRGIGKELQQQELFSGNLF